MIHSTSLRATGSEMVAWTPVALSAPPLRRLSMALLTSATSGSEVCGVGVCASGTAGGWGKPVLVPRAAALAGAKAPDESGRGRGRGTAAAVVLPDADFFSLGLPDAAFFTFAALAATFAVAADELLVPPLVAALLAATQSVTASRLAQASATTSADRRCRVKSTYPRSPDASLPPSVVINVLGLTNPMAP